VHHLGISQTLLGNTALAAIVEAEELARVAVPARRGRSELALCNISARSSTSPRSTRNEGVEAELDLGDGRVREELEDKAEVRASSSDSRRAGRASRRAASSIPPGSEGAGELVARRALTAGHLGVRGAAPHPLEQAPPQAPRHPLARRQLGVGLGERPPAAPAAVAALAPHQIRDAPRSAGRAPAPPGAA
jgi:hypothetical protein